MNYILNVSKYKTTKAYAIEHITKHITQTLLLNILKLKYKSYNFTKLSLDNAILEIKKKHLN